MKVLYTLGRLDVGGAEMRTLKLVTSLKARRARWSLWIYVISGQTGTLDDDFRRLGVQIIYGRPGLAGLAHVWKTMRSLRPDILHTNVSTASGYYALAARLAGVRTVISHYRSLGDTRSGPAHAAKAAVGRMLANGLSNRVIGVCDAAQAFAKAPDRKWRTVYNGVEISSSQRQPAAGLTIGYLGRLSPEKNPLRALAIMDAVRAHPKAADARMRIAGTGSAEMQDAMQAEIAARGLGPHVRLIGNTGDPLGFLRECDVLVLPSLREGLPGAVLEALSVGTPVVAADLPGVGEIERETTGVTRLSLGDPDQAWAQAIFASATRDKSEIAEAFGRSPFQIERHTDQMAALWGLNFERGDA